MRERLKEPRKGSEIEPEIVCVQGVGALRLDILYLAQGKPSNIKIMLNKVGLAPSEKLVEFRIEG